MKHINENPINGKKITMAEYVRIAVNNLNLEDLEAARRKYKRDELDASVS